MAGMAYRNRASRMKKGMAAAVLVFLMQCAFLGGCAASGKVEDIHAEDESVMMQDRETIPKSQFEEAERQGTLEESLESEEAVTWGHRQ